MERPTTIVPEGNKPTSMEAQMSVSIEEKNKAIVLQAFDTLFNQRDYSRAERFWSPRYIQHSDHIRPGREGLFELVRNAPATMRYENQLILANGDFLMLHGRFSGLGAGTPNWIVVDVVRLENGVLAEHWDVIQDEATRAVSKSGSRCSETSSLTNDTYPTDDGKSLALTATRRHV